MKSLEELAEIGHEAFTKVMGYTGHAWASLSDRTKAAKIAQTLAIIHEVLGPVTEEELGDAWTSFQKPGEGRVSMNRALARFLSSRLTHYTRTASPVEVPKPDDEVERVAETAEEIARRELEDVANFGLRYDTNPTIQITTSANDTAFRYVQYIQEMDKSARNRARATLAAMGGGKRFGVYNEREQRWLKLGTDAFFTRDENAAKVVKWLADSHWPHALHQVREYTPPASPEIPREALAEFKKAFDFYACDGHDKAVQMGLDAAIRHLRGGE